MRHILSSKIVRRLLIILISLTVIPILILGVILMQTGQEATRTAVLRDYQEIASRAAMEIDLLIRGPQDMLTAMAAIVGVTHTDPWKQETAMVEMRLNARSFEQLVFVGLEGQVKASGASDHALSDSTFAVLTMTALNTLTASPKNGFYRSGVYLLPGRVPAMTMAAPVRQFGRTIGILAAQVNLREMWDLVHRINIGQTGSIYVIDEDGVVVAHRNLKPVLQRENWKHLTPVQRVLGGENGSLDYTKPGDEAVLAAYAPLPSLKGGVVVEQPVSEAYATIDTMRSSARWITVFSALAAMVIGILVARSIVKPVLRLVEGTRGISRGDLTHRIELDRQDEIGQLALSFNEMAESLKASRDSLEQQVAERTAQLRHTLEELRRLSDLRTKFVSDMAHELRTPLTSIQGYADTLVRLESTMTDEQRRQCCVTISEECTRVARMINDLLDLSRIESGRSGLNRMSVSVVSVARSAIQAAHPGAVDKDIWIGLYAPEGLPPVYADRDAIRRVFDNLIDNAIKYSTNGGVISVSVSMDNDRVLVSVADTGIGIPEKDLPHIFERFFRVKTPGARTPGTGLGLPIVKSIIEEHGGEVFARSVQGEGSVLSFTLPAVFEKGTVYESTLPKAHTRSG